MAQPTEPIGDLTIASSTPTLPSFAALTPTPIIDIFHFPPGNLTGPIPTPTPPHLLGPGQIPDLEVTHIEITQGMQDLDNDMPLVANRMTFLRVYVKTDGADYPNVKLLVQGTRAGQPIGVLTADNQPITAHGDGGDRVNVNDSFYVQLPQSWTDPGALFLKAFVYAGSPQAPFTEEPNADNNFLEDFGVFGQGSEANLSFIPVHLHVNFSPSMPEKLYTQSEPDFATIVVGMLRHLPISGFELYPPPWPEVYCYGSSELEVYDLGQQIGEHGNCEFNLSVPGGSDYVTVIMAMMQAITDDPADPLLYYGMVHPDFDPQFKLFNNVGNLIHITGMSLNGEAYGEMTNNIDPASPWYIDGSETLAHELGHRYGRAHVLCAGNELAGGNVDDNYPWPSPDCSIAEVDPEGFYGFDVYYMALPGVNEPTVISNDPAAPNPNRGFPLMGYQGRQFEDAYDWCRIMEVVGPHCDWSNVILQESSTGDPHLASVLMPRPSSGSLLNSSAFGFGGFDLQTGPFLLVSGVVKSGPVQASLGEVLSLPKPPAHLPGYPDKSTIDSGFDLVIADQSDQVLATTPIEDTTINHQPLGVIAFLTGLPVPPGAAAIEIRHAGRTLARRAFSAHAPTVELLSPNGGETFTGPFQINWQGSDEDGDPLTYTLQYSPDNGKTWQALALGLTGTSYQVLSLYDLTGSDQGLIRVMASDGTQTTSDVSDGTFTIPNSPPMPVIQSPGDLAVVPVNGRVSLIASGTDREDGVLPPESLTWESSIDGFLGTGNHLEVIHLSPGNHVLTLTAEDSQGATAQAHVRMVVDADWVRSVPSDDELALASQILAAGPNFSLPVTETTEAPKSLLPLYFVLGGAAVLGLIALGLFIPLLRGRRR